MLEMQPLMQCTLALWSLFSVGVADVQQSSRKDRRDAYLLLRGHLQAPDFDDGKE